MQVIRGTGYGHKIYKRSTKAFGPATTSKEPLNRTGAEENRLTNGTARRFSKEPTGTWAWNCQNRRGRTNEFKLTLINRHDLTGTITFSATRIEIEEGKVKNGEISFSVRRRSMRHIITWKYKGKVISDTIRGRIDLIGGERDRVIDWTAQSHRLIAPCFEHKTEKLLPRRKFIGRWPAPSASPQQFS